MNEKIANFQYTFEITTYIKNVVNKLKDYNFIDSKQKALLLILKVSGYLEHMVNEMQLSKLEKINILTKLAETSDILKDCEDYFDI